MPVLKFVLSLKLLLSLPTIIGLVQATFQEPHLPIFIDLKADYQTLMETSYLSLPTITLCANFSVLCAILYLKSKGAHATSLMLLPGHSHRIAKVQKNYKADFETGRRTLNSF